LTELLKKGDCRMHPNETPDTALLPATGEALPQTQQPGYYPGYRILSQQKFWDEATRKLILMRVEQPPPIRYFTPAQVTFWRAVFDHLLPQFDRTPERRIPMVEPVDERLYHNRTIGFRYASMPTDREAFALGEQAINAEAQHRFGGDFVYLPQHQQDLVLKALHDQTCEAAPEIWAKMSLARFWQMLMQDALESYYSHPWSWDEVGFGGPAYPRAYTRLERGEPEPWEVEEQRYEWAAPAYAVSDETANTQDQHTEARQNG